MGSCRPAFSASSVSSAVEFVACGECLYRCAPIKPDASKTKSDCQRTRRCSVSDSTEHGHFDPQRPSLYGIRFSTCPVAKNPLDQDTLSPLLLIRPLYPFFQRSFAPYLLFFVFLVQNVLALNCFPRISSNDGSAARASSSSWRGGAKTSVATLRPLLVYTRTLYTGCRGEVQGKFLGQRATGSRDSLSIGAATPQEGSQVSSNPLVPSAHR
jgi:hypothetical protein